MNITDGKVEYEHPHKVAEFQYPKAKVALSFTLGEGEDAAAALAVVGDMAKHRAMVMSGAVVEDAPETAAARPTIRAKRTPPAPPLSETQPSTAPATADASASSVAPLAGAASDPFGGATVASDTSGAAPNGASPPASAAVIPDPRLTDKGIQDATAAKIASAKDRQAATIAVKKLRAKFTGSPELPMAHVTDPAKLTQYLTELNALTV